MRRMVCTLALSSSNVVAAAAAVVTAFGAAYVKVFVCTAEAHQNTAQFSSSNIDFDSYMHIDMLIDWYGTNITYCIRTLG